MDLKGIMSIAGQKGLFKHISETKNGIIVESLEDKKRMPAYSTAKISALEDISIFTEDDDISLVDVFKKIHEKENGKPAINHKLPNEELKKYFAEALPEYDRDRVYISDIKKVLNWYNVLQKVDMLDFTEDNDSKEEDKKDVEEVKVVKKTLTKQNVKSKDIKKPKPIEPKAKEKHQRKKSF
ncbi:MAG: DUF5606 domain-containing protein [Bacteroidales bacterium]|nr:DUF5606 domain-containing protein [Bacteroidales bacterium]